MRWLCFLAICLSASVATAASPLTNKEALLMLRSGYSNESVQAELQARGVCEAFDPAVKKTMLEFGASAQLIAALESGVDDPGRSRAHRRHADSQRPQAEAGSLS